MSLLSMMVVSIGLGLALRFLILVINGGLPRAYPDWAGQGAVQMGGIPIVPKHLATIAVALVLLAGVGLFLNRTQAGTALRAVRDNPDLSESSGIDVQRVIALTWVVGGLLAAAGGVFFGLTESLQWDMGFKLLLLMFSAVILGGIGTAYGTMLGSFVVGCGRGDERAGRPHRTEERRRPVHPHRHAAGPPPGSAGRT
jgi:neutral amino acid transport system permease protein